MSDAQKTPYSRTLTSFATAQALDQIKLRGTSLPGHVTAIPVSGVPIVTVKFDLTDVTLHQVTMPVLGSQYFRDPIQVGDKGEAWPGSIYLGGISGLGGGSADIGTLRGNMSALVWVPVGNKTWTPVNGGYAVVQGPNGAQIMDLNGVVVGTFDKTNGITLSFGGHTIKIESSGVYIDGTLWTTHDHGPGTYVAGSTAVTGNSGGVVG